MNKLCILEVNGIDYKIPEKVIKSYQKLQQENQQLKSMICPIYEKCQKGECDCTHEEYNSMCEKNMKMSVELNEYKSIVNKAIELLSKINYEDINEYIPPLEILPVYEILKELEEGNSNDR